LIAVTVSVDPAELPALTGAGEEADALKSRNWNVTVVEWLRLPLVPVSVRVKFPATVALHDTVAVPEFVMLFGEIAVQVRLAGGVSVSETIPVKPFTAVTVMVDVWDWPTLVGLGVVSVIEKSGLDGTVTATFAECERLPLTPVTLTL
jgi:hypothetical protein